MSGWCVSLSKPEKGLWTIVILAAIAVLIYEWVLVIGDFVQYPFRSHVIYEEEDFLELPTVLLCSRDPINNTIGSKLSPSQSTIRYVQQLTYPSATSPSSFAQLQQSEITTGNDDFNRFANQYYSDDKWRAYVDLHFKCEGMITRCQIGDGPNMTAYDCCIIAKHVTSPVGPCVSFTLPDQYIPSYLGGFHIDIEIRSSDLQSSVNGVPFPGIDVYIGDSVEKPMYPALRLQRDSIYSIKLRAQTHLKSNKRKCNKQMADSYFTDMPFIAATMNCTSKIIYNRCNCYPFFKLQTDNREQSSTCDWNKLTSCANETLRMMKEKRNVTDLYNQQYSSICGTITPPCSWMKYETTVTMDKDLNINPINFAAKLTFYYEDFEVLIIEQYFAPNFHDVIIQVGGALVFWFVIIHILMYIVEGFKLCKTNTKQNNKIEDAEMMAPPKSHLPPVVTHFSEQQTRVLEPLPPITVNEGHQETQTHG